MPPATSTSRDTDNHRIQKFTGSGVYLTQWGSYGTGDGQFFYPVGVTTDASANVYVADLDNHRIQKFGPATPPDRDGVRFHARHPQSGLSGLWITGFLEPPSPFAPAISTSRRSGLNDTVPVDPAAPTALGDHDADGIPDLMVKFNRAAVELTLSEGDSVPVVVTGPLGDNTFSGTDYIRVRRARWYQRRWPALT